MVVVEFVARYGYDATGDVAHNVNLKAGKRDGPATVAVHPGQMQPHDGARAHPICARYRNAGMQAVEKL